jgi:ABC-type multidrug transport system ATPase subunit
MQTPGVVVELQSVHYIVPGKSTGWTHRLAARLRTCATPTPRPKTPADSPPTTTHQLDLQNPTNPHAGSASSPSSSPTSPASTILHGVNGLVLPGESLAILGPSGSGKTSLLNILSGRSEYDIAAGRITFDGRPRNARTKRQIGYVMQDDVFFSNLTVRQTLEFTAAIRLSDSLTKQQVCDRVDQVVARLRLDKCQHIRIGDQQFDKGVSGGERKRANIANELLADPALLLLDEPTSGLDASTAMAVVRLLRDLSDEGKTVISTIHQPSSAMFGLFDKLMLLAEGRVAYFGPAADAQAYFSSIGYAFPPNYNPCDYLIQLVIDNVTHRCDGLTGDLACGDEGSRCGETCGETSAARVVRLWSEKQAGAASAATNDGADERTVIGSGRVHAVGKGMKRAIGKRVNDVRRRPDPQGLPVKYESSWISQIGSLCVRTMRQKLGRLLDVSQLQLLAAVTLVSCLFWYKMEEAESTIRDRLGALFFFNLFWSYITMFWTLFAFPSERAVLNKDRASGAYRLSAYYTAKTLVEMPADCIYPLIFCVIVYWVVGFNHSVWAFMTFTIVVLASSLTSQSIGMTISSGVPDMRRALVVATCFMLATMLMAGLFVSNYNIPGFIRPLKYLSYLKYSYEALVRNEVSHQTYRCAAGDVSTIYSQNGIKCPVRGPDVLNAVGVNEGLSVVGNLCILLLWNFIVRLLGYLLLKHFNTHHKPKSGK